MESELVSPSQVENGSRIRVRVREGNACVPLAPGTPMLSSAHSAWNGALLEKHAHGPHHAARHQHLSHFLCMHVGDPAPLAWRSRGNAGSKVISAGEFVLVSRGGEDEVSFPKPVKRILLNLEPWLVDQACPSAGSGREIELIDQWVIRDLQVERIIRTLEADLENGLPAGRLFGETLLNALAIHLRTKYAVFPLMAPRIRGGLSRPRLRQVIDYIDANLEREITLDHLAATTGMGAHYFAESFKKSVGFSPHQYVIRKRIDRARRLLQDSRIPVLEAGVRSGFSDHSHFTRMFRRIVGVPPHSLSG